MFFDMYRGSQTNVFSRYARANASSETGSVSSPGGSVTSHSYTEKIFSRAGVAPEQEEFPYGDVFLRLIYLNPFVRVFFRLGTEVEIAQLVSVMHEVHGS